MRCPGLRCAPPRRRLLRCLPLTMRARTPLLRRWGVPDSAFVVQAASKLCLREVQACQKDSLGPSFLLFLTQKYGYCPPPSSVPADVFQAYVAEMSDADQQLVHTWYEVDDNAQPPAAVLRAPVSAASAASGGPDRSHAAFAAACHRLVGLLGPVNTAGGASLTELEADAGLFGVVDAPSTATVFRREIPDVEQHIHSRNAQPFLDRDCRSGAEAEGAFAIDAGKGARLAALQQRVVDTGMCKAFCLPWAHELEYGGTCAAYIDYLTELCVHTARQLLQQVGKAVSESEVGAMPAYCAEALEHSTHARALREGAALDSRPIDDIVRAYFSSTSASPLVLHGPDGCGKSLALASVAHRAACPGVNPEPLLPAVEGAAHGGWTVVCRFIGLTPDSSSPTQLLRSICQQLAAAYAADDEVTAGTSRAAEMLSDEDFAGLVQQLPRHLALATAARPLLLVVDGLEQLVDEPHKRDEGRGILAWFPATLPPHVKLLAATREDDRCFPALRGALVDALVPCPPPSTEDKQAILEGTLAQAGRRVVSPAQRAVLDDALTRAASGLHVHLLALEAATWSSSDRHVLDGEATRVQLGSVPALFRRVLERTELRHGAQLVRACVGALSVSRSGLTLGELERVAAGSAAVAQEVFGRWAPRKEGCVPQHVLLALVRDLDPHLVCKADGVVDWRHREYGAVAATMYCGGEGEAEARSALVSLFQAELEQHQRRRGQPTLSLSRIAANLPWLLHRSRNMEALRECLLDHKVLAELYQQQVAGGNYDITHYWHALGTSPGGIAEAYMAPMELSDTDPRPDEATFLQDVLASFLYDAGHYGAAGTVLDTVLLMRMRALGEEHADTARTLCFQGRIQSLLNNITAMLDLNTRAYQVSKASLGPKHPSTAAVMNNIAIAHRRLGNMDEALQWYKRAADVYDIDNDKEHLKASSVVLNMAVVRSFTGDYAKATPLYTRVIETRKRLLGEDPRTAKAYQSYAQHCFRQRNYAEAQEYSQQALGTVARGLHVTRSTPSTPSTPSNH